MKIPVILILVFTMYTQCQDNHADHLLLVRGRPYVSGYDVGGPYYTTSAVDSIPVYTRTDYNYYKIYISQPKSQKGTKEEVTATQVRFPDPLMEVTTATLVQIKLSTKRIEQQTFIIVNLV